MHGADARSWPQVCIKGPLSYTLILAPDPLEMDLEEVLPGIKDAHAYLKHRKYSSALQVYVEILNSISQDSEEYSHVLLEYAQCLLECVMFQTEMDYKKILETQSSSNGGDVEDDLENCWECLETCRLNFEYLNNRSRLAEVFKGLGDVQCLKNMFEEGRSEYLKAIDYCDDEYGAIELLECVADCHRNMKQYDEALEYYNQILEAYSKLGMKDMEEECKCLIEGLQVIKAQHKESDESAQQALGSDEPVDVNHLKR